ncbi:MAG: hypothetical protein U0T83_04330 [Bacteriovoracaceae bacterium]
MFHKIFILTFLFFLFWGCEEEKGPEKGTLLTTQKVLAVNLTGYATPTNSSISESNTIVKAFSNIQGQINAREKTITAGTTSQYYRGDKSMQTLSSSVIPENGNLYFTNARTLIVPLTGLQTTDTTTVTSSDSLLTSLGKIQAQLDNKLASAGFVNWTIAGAETIHTSRLNLGTSNLSKAVVTDASGLLTTSSVTTTELAYLSGVSSNIQTQIGTKQDTVSLTTTLSVQKLRVYGTSNTTFYTEVDVPALGSTLDFILPSTNGTNNYILKTDGVGNLSWVAASSLASVASVNSQTGAVVLTTTDIAEGTPRYFATASVSADILATVLTGLSTATNSTVTNTDSLLVAMGKLQAQLASLDSTKLDVTGGTFTGTIDGVPTPTSSTQLATKLYVDNTIGIATTCPTGFILVPKNTSYYPVDFCVMKYEAKDDGYGTAVSTASGSPWVSINRANARSACKNLGAGYDLISNDQWQTLARNIAGVATNWSNGVVLDDQLNRGHTDSAPNNALAASSDDVNGNCSGTGQTCDSSTWDSQRRTHVLSNGNIIWDFSGNVYEWVTNNNTAVNGVGGYMSTMSGGDIRQTRYGASAFCSIPGSSPYCGMGYGDFASNAGTIVRGGCWGSDLSGGIFAGDFLFNTAATGAAIGFRCIFVP